jgi:low affinity Fe/Cu permease
VILSEVDVVASVGGPVRGGTPARGGTQARAQAATQRKLDEILLASPEADNTLITLEEAPDNELKEATDAHRDAHRDARRDASQESPS